jgi:hypothetical protein
MANYFVLWIPLQHIEFGQASAVAVVVRLAGGNRPTVGAIKRAGSAAEGRSESFLPLSADKQKYPEVYWSLFRPQTVRIEVAGL